MTKTALLLSTLHVVAAFTGASSAQTADTAASVKEEVLKETEQMMKIVNPTFPCPDVGECPGPYGKGQDRR
ncbi:MAG: hypothetical protein ABTQ31_03220 [Rhizobiaceae bacterium]|mgnify:CR=1 FL=1